VPHARQNFWSGLIAAPHDEQLSWELGAGAAAAGVSQSSACWELWAGAADFTGVAGGSSVTGGVGSSSNTGIAAAAIAAGRGSSVTVGAGESAVAGSGWPTGAAIDADAAAAIVVADGACVLVSLRSKSCTPAISEPPQERQNLFDGGLLAPHDGHADASVVAAAALAFAGCASAFARLAPHDRQNLLVVGLLALQAGHVDPLESSVSAPDFSPG